MVTRDQLVDCIVSMLLVVCNVTMQGCFISPLQESCVARQRRRHLQQCLLG